MFILKLTASVLLNGAIFAAPFFLLAGTLDWWRAWVIVGVMLVGSAGAIVSLYHGDRGLLEERLKPAIQKGQPLVDKVVVLLLLASFLALLAFIPLDVFHLHLMNKPGTLVSSLGLVLVAVGWSIAYLGLRENSFAAPVVKFQQERCHTVITTGVYHTVRHPMYAGGGMLIAGLPLWLQSYAGALFSMVPIASLVLRIVFEERFLKRKLKDYDGYMAKVRYRLIPYLW